MSSVFWTGFNHNIVSCCSLSVWTQWYCFCCPLTQFLDDHGQEHATSNLEIVTLCACMRKGYTIGHIIVYVLCAYMIMCIYIMENYQLFGILPVKNVQRSTIPAFLLDLDIVNVMVDAGSFQVVKYSESACSLHTGYVFFGTWVLYENLWLRQEITRQHSCLS